MVQVDARGEVLALTLQDHGTRGLQAFAVGPVAWP